MVRKSRGFRKGTRKKFQQRGKPTINRFLQRFELGDRVNVSACPNSRGLPHHRFQGKSGVVAAKRGKAYVVNLKLGNADKTIILKPEHLRKV